MTNTNNPDDVPPAMSDVLATDEQAKQIRGFPDYFITSEARIFSLKGRSPHEMAQYPDGGSDLVVNLRKNGDAHKRSVKRLWADHFGDTRAPYWETYQYLLEEYDDPKVHEWAENNVKPLCGSDGVGRHWDSRYLQIDNDT